jgi:hypothetical protein
MVLATMGQDLAQSGTIWEKNENEKYLVVAEGLRLKNHKGLMRA